MSRQIAVVHEIVDGRQVEWVPAPIDGRIIDVAFVRDASGKRIQVRFDPVRGAPIWPGEV